MNGFWGEVTEMLEDVLFDLIPVAGWALALAAGSALSTSVVVLTLKVWGVL